ncbi:hypothetical protein FE257_005663 [Aspergillus nanangensis]|uniref:Metallo-beta-lactamase domain-containing protein n=1 Tax=Aspergillus nanangensis TaxID=2582783 RepID=A0AAD4CA51_ASPNN|nr:hypothetical protein FE257_005663 [Aspergillus nanangensis]
MTHIGTTTAILNIDGVNLLTDPVFSPAGTEYNFGPIFLKNKDTPALQLKDLPPIDAVLLSHEDHPDNLDEPGRRLLDGRRVLTTMDGAKNLAPRPGVQGLQPWGNRGECTGFILTTETFGVVCDGRPNAIYFSGDTVYMDGLAPRITQRWNVVVAILNFGNAQVDLPTGPLQVTMDGKQGARLFRELQAEILIPMHYESCVHFKQGVQELKASLTEEKVGDKVCCPVAPRKNTMTDTTVEAKASPSSAVDELPPEEGVQGWLCVLGSFLCLFCSFGFLNAIGVFQATYQETFLKEYSASDISWIFSIQVALMWAPGPLYGRVIDTYGPAPVLYPCSFLCVLGLCMTSLADQYYQIFLAQGLCFGIGAGGVFTAAMISVGQWFVRRRGLATGIASSGSSLGGVVFPIFFNRVMAEVGFYGAVRYTALFIGVLLAASCLLVRSRLPRRKWSGDVAWIDMKLFKQKAFALYTLGSFFTMWGLWAPFNYVSSMAINAGFSPTLALYLISILNSTSIPGRIIPPHLGDRIGHFNVLTICAMLTGGSILCLWLPFNYHPSHAGIIVFALVYGFVSGAVVCLLVPCVAKIGDLTTLGQRFGTFQMIISVSCLTGLPTMGAILNRQHNTDYSGLQIFSSCVCLLGSLGLAGATYLLGKSRETWRCLDGSPSQSALARQLDHLIADYPEHVDRIHQDGLPSFPDAKSQIWLAYWKSPEDYEHWWQQGAMSFWEALSDDAGMWREILIVHGDRTQFATNKTRKSGLGHLGPYESVGDKTGYWGCYYHRIPAVTPDNHFPSPVTAPLNPPPTDGIRSGRITMTHFPDNLCFVVEGQDHSRITTHESQHWLENLDKPVTKWMEDLQTAGAENGVLDARMCYEPDSGRFRDSKPQSLNYNRKIQLFYFLDMESMERIGRMNRGHVALRRDFINSYAGDGVLAESGELCLWVETSILRSPDIQCEFISEYVYYSPLQWLVFLLSAAVTKRPSWTEKTYSKPCQASFPSLLPENADPRLNLNFMLDGQEHGTTTPGTTTAREEAPSRIW